MLKLSPVSTSSFSVSASDSGGHVVLLLSGNADTLVLGRFSGFMKTFHDEVSEAHVREVHVDTEKLYFMTSSCLKVLVAWLTSITELGADKRYRVVFVANPDLHWQRRSFEALRHIASGLVTVQPQSPASQKP